MHIWQKRLSFIMITIVLVHGLSFSLLQLTYNLSPEVFEAHCVNKAKPELSCKGKCCLKKLQTQTNSPSDDSNLSKRISIDFEYTITSIKRIQPIEYNLQASYSPLVSNNPLSLYRDTPEHPPQV